ncbi:MAG: ABC transporter permease [Chloroflexi bacterium]|nr:ABC transporter permease [Chloroflexota bacterium]
MRAARRFVATLRRDALVQYRNGLYQVSLVVVAAVFALIRIFPARPGDFGPLLPGFLIMVALITTFYFIGALVLLERDEGMLSGLAVTPLRLGEWLGARVVSLVFLALAENLAIVLLAYGTGFQPLPLLFGLLMLGGIYTLLGLVAIAPYDTINAYLLPSVPWVLGLLVLPLLGYFDLWSPGVLYLHPVQPSLLLMRAAFVAPPAWEMVYAATGSLFWLALSWILALRAARRLVQRATGG